eukprot:238152_1
MPTNRETTNSDGNDNTDGTHDGCNRNGHNHGNGTNGHNHDGGDDRKGNDHEDDEFAQDEPHHRCNHLQECSGEMSFTCKMRYFTKTLYVNTKHKI